MSKKSLNTREGRQAYYQPIISELPKIARDVLQFCLIDHPFCDAAKVMASVFVGLVLNHRVEIHELWRLDRINTSRIHDLIDEAHKSTNGWDYAALKVQQFHKL